jgi:hypothetical protein
MTGRWTCAAAIAVVFALPDCASTGEATCLPHYVTRPRGGS